MTQLSMKASLKRWEKKVKQEVTNKLLQLHMQDNFLPIDPKTLSKNEYDKVLESHLLLKQKRDQSIKGRMVAGRNKQRGHIDKTDETSPTAALESVLLISTIDAKEGREVAIIDILNAFVYYSWCMYHDIAINYWLLLYGRPIAAQLVCCDDVCLDGNVHPHGIPIPPES